MVVKSICKNRWLRKVKKNDKRNFYSQKGKHTSKLQLVQLEMGQQSGVQDKHLHICFWTHSLEYGFLNVSKVAFKPVRIRGKLGIN